MALHRFSQLLYSSFISISPIRAWAFVLCGVNLLATCAFLLAGLMHMILHYLFCELVPCTSQEHSSSTGQAGAALVCV
jgi:hypothetical protein